MKMKKSIKNILRIGALAGCMTFMSCDKNIMGPEHNPTFLSNIHEIQIANDLERPSGLSSNYISLKKSINTESFQNTNLGVLAQGPIFY